MKFLWKLLLFKTSTIPLSLICSKKRNKISISFLNYQAKIYARLTSNNPIPSARIFPERFRWFVSHDLIVFNILVWNFPNINRIDWCLGTGRKIQIEKFYLIHDWVEASKKEKREKKMHLKKNEKMKLKEKLQEGNNLPILPASRNRD